MLVQVAVAHAAAVEDCRVIEQRAVPVWSRLQLLQEMPEQLHVVRVDLLLLGDEDRIVAMVRHRMVLLGDADLRVGPPTVSRAISNDPVFIAKKQKIDTYHMQLLGHFLEKLQATPDGDGTLLHHSTILYGGGMGDGNLHEQSIFRARGGRSRRAVENRSAPRLRRQHADGKLLYTVLDKAKGADRADWRQHWTIAAQKRCQASSAREAQGEFNIHNAGICVVLLVLVVCVGRDAEGADTRLVDAVKQADTGGGPDPPPEEGRS